MMMSLLQRPARLFARRLGYRVHPIHTEAQMLAATAQPPTINASNLDVMGARRRHIASMTAESSARMLYSMCFLQQIPGDVVEIGAWQGYTTSYLAQAVKDAGNGRVIAIDHFRGNPGREARYVVGRPDLSDLKENFLANLAGLDLQDVVQLLDMPSEDASAHLSGTNIRFLLIDGEHTREAVQRDINLYFPLLADGAIVVFDDYSPAYPGLVEAVNEAVTSHPPRGAMTYWNTLVVQY